MVFCVIGRLYYAARIWCFLFPLLLLCFLFRLLLNFFLTLACILSFPSNVSTATIYTQIEQLSTLLRNSPFTQCTLLRSHFLYACLRLYIEMGQTKKWGFKLPSSPFGILVIPKAFPFSSNRIVRSIFLGLARVSSYNATPQFRLSALSRPTNHPVGCLSLFNPPSHHVTDTTQAVPLMALELLPLRTWLPPAAGWSPLNLQDTGHGLSPRASTKTRAWSVAEWNSSPLCVLLSLQPLHSLTPVGCGTRRPRCDGWFVYWCWCGGKLCALHPLWAFLQALFLNSRILTPQNPPPSLDFSWDHSSCVCIPILQSFQLPSLLQKRSTTRPVEASSLL